MHEMTQHVHVEVVLQEDHPAALRALRNSLLRTPRTLPAQYLYDDHGSRLFEQITELPEYYQTRTERQLLHLIADEVVRRSGVEELVELGSGASTKTRILLDAMQRADQLQWYVPFDVSEGIVRRASQELAEQYPDMRIHGVIGDFVKQLDAIPRNGRRLIVFLGGTIGNFTAQDARRFLHNVHDLLQPGEHLLLGTDLIKEPQRLHAAYNDSQGVTAAFNRNILSVLNDQTEADFDIEAFEHEAFYNIERHRIEMWLRATRAQRIQLHKLDLTLFLEPGNRLLTEISVKYDRERIEALLHRSGLALEALYTDANNDFALSLIRRPEPS
jgi:L-histidine N-alpha-methyltransferase